MRKWEETSQHCLLVRVKLKEKEEKVSATQQVRVVVFALR